jgi:hypothetical protein
MSILDSTIQNLLLLLRYRLNDSDLGNYTDDELAYCIQAAYRALVVQAKCHKVRKSVALVVNQAAYDCGEIFEPVRLSVDGKALSRRELGERDCALQDSQAGTPEEWMHVSGSQIEVFPTPSAAGELVVEGFASPPEFTSSPDALPDGYAVNALLDAAEGEARRMRAMFPQNAEMAAALMQAARTWAESIRGSVGRKW